MAGAGGTRILQDEAVEEKGERARMASFVGAMAIADLVKTTLGPKGMDKILQSTGRGQNIMVTNDGATILKSLYVDNPAAKVLVDISKVQDDEVGDGTTSVVVLAGELLREAEKLISQKIHPMTIISGFRAAAETGRGILEKASFNNSKDKDKFRRDLLNIAMTTLSSKILSQDKEHFAELAVDAVLRLQGSGNLEAIQIIQKPGGSLQDSFLDEGFILDKRIGVGQPKRIENAKILVANTPMDTDKIKIYGARVRVDSMSKVADIEAAEKDKMRQKCDKIIQHGINCFVNRQLIYNFPEEIFADAGVMAIEHADFDGIERLALVTGGEIVSTFDDPTTVKLGHCKLIEEIMIGEDKLIHFIGVDKPEACTIVLRGASTHVLEEAERSLHDALCVLSQTVKDSRVIYGGGFPEVMMSNAIEDLARRTPGKRAMAIEAFATALRGIPSTIAENAGLDAAEIVTQLRAEHAKERSKAGVDVIRGTIGNMEELGIYESFKVKQAVLMSATEAAEMIMRVDEIIKCAPRKREGMGHGM
ncbi:TCP-1/cpn60 chaperonin family protein [Klebsormidium nitens]|uniref:CCT-beta n=1 Tax=Klebsormidium nitens TaxID=105231 RepID=A0A1Y1ILD3_KLENI|nr:TCP-1/cpn60 chaperonin family protein [Klebsormidium nitens]|eukprot:GAQ90249.1 TCP-1/cpn60 chaperonin family protein [Klebsormidium nitens]